MQGKIRPTHSLAINGMGRIGRTLLRVLYEKGSIKNLIAVNDIMSKDNLIYLLKYDSIRGMLPGNISPTVNGFAFDGHEIFYSQENQIAKLNWGNHSIGTVVEATGVFTHSTEASLHISNGAKQVLISTYSKDIPTTVLGVNHREVNHETEIISPGDCTINCVAPLIDLMQKHFGVDSVHINVVQAYTTRQQLIDGPYKGLRRGRAASHSIVPFEVYISPVLENLFPALKDKIESMSTRVPIPCGAIADISFVLKTPTDAKKVNSIITKTSEEELKNITSINFDPIVSSDILGNPNSSTIDGSLTRVSNGKHLKLLAWFDNEWGYANRLFDWLSIVGAV
jgi:glyceraldehyde 3-phosphate dehydrogenase